jgi:hypothetical protein
MKQFLFLAAGILATGGLLAAQGHDNMTAKTVKDTIMFSTNVRVGTTVLKAGMYRITCDREKMSFTLLYEKKDAERIELLDPADQVGVVGNGKKVLEVPCKGPQLAVNWATTEAQFGSEKDGVQVLEKLYLRGSNIEHVF